MTVVGPWLLCPGRRRRWERAFADRVARAHGWGA